MLTKSLFVLAFSNLLIRQYVEAYYARDSSIRMRRKLVMMDLELYKDAKAKVMAIWHMRKHYHRSSSYQLARIVYAIRRKYARMIFVYFKTLNDFDDLNQYIHFDHLREVQHLAYDIDNLIQAMEEWEDRRTRKKRITRMGGPRSQKEDPDIKALRLKEQRLKQRAYIERKKMLWSLKQGNSRTNLEKSQFRKKDKVEEGFESDMIENF